MAMKLSIVLKKSTHSRVLGYVFLVFALLTAGMVVSLGWKPDFNQENIVEILYVNAMPGLAVLLWIAFAAMGVVMLAKDVLEADPRAGTLTYRLHPPLQPNQRYRFADFHTVSAESHHSSRGNRYFTLELKGGSKSLVLNEASIDSAQAHAQELARCCGLGYEGTPYWEIPEQRLQPESRPGSSRPPRGLNITQDQKGLSVVFPGQNRWRWLLLLPYAGLMVTSWWAMTPWYIYLLWTALAGGSIAWLGWTGKDHTLTLRDNIVSYRDHSGSVVFELDLFDLHYLDLKGDDILAATPGSYLVLRLPRATTEQKSWLKDEFLRSIARQGG